MSDRFSSVWRWQPSALKATSFQASVPSQHWLLNFYSIIPRKRLQKTSVYLKLVLFAILWRLVMWSHFSLSNYINIVMFLPSGINFVKNLKTDSPTPSQHLLLSLQLSRWLEPPWHCCVFPGVQGALSQTLSKTAFFCLNFSKCPLNGNFHISFSLRVSVYFVFFT